MKPELQQRLMNAVRAHQDGDLESAKTGYECVLADHPDQPDALHYLGMIAFQKGDAQTALALVERARSISPRDPAIAANLGLVLMELNRLGDAESVYRSALELDSAQPQAWFNLGLVQQRLLRHTDALGSFRQSLAILPGHDQARQQLGVSLLALGAGQQAVQAFRACLAGQPQNAQLQFQLGLALVSAGELKASITALEKASGDPTMRARAQANLSTVLRRLERNDEALTAARSAIAHDERDPDALRSLGHALKAAGRLEEAGETYRRAHQMLRTPGATPDPSLPTFTMTTRAKLRHDAEQLTWLAEQGMGDDRYPAWIADCRAMIAAIPASLPDGELMALPSAEQRPPADWYNRCLHLGSAERVEPAALSPDLDPGAISRDYHRRQPGITWIDDFLTPSALHLLRRFCLESTIWYDCDHPNGYLGAYLQDGFACPLLVQIATELSTALPEIFGEHRLMQLWAYKYDSRLSGIDIHADFAAINVNFWITPNDANLDPAAGGMVIWDVEAPLEWTMDEYNTYDPVQQDAIRAFLDERGAQRLVIPHRQNRCAVFNSNLLHRTDDIHFRPGYENRRINITMLFGHRERTGAGNR